MTADDATARDFARAFRSFLDWVHEAPQTAAADDPVVRLVHEHAGPDVADAPVVSRGFPVFDHVNVQTALEAWGAEPGRTVVVHGLARPPHYGPLELHALLHPEHRPAVRLTAPELVDLPTGPDRTLACYRLALLLVTDARGSYVLLVRGPVEEPRLVLEVGGLDTAAAQEVLRELAAASLRLNVYRGQLLELVAGPAGVQVAFPKLAPTSREDVVLPEVVLRRVERHALEVTARADDLRAAGQHLKRGLLLFGPPGTGKTHTTRYLVQRLAGTTVLLLSGRALHLVGEVTALARDLQPAAVVLEDVDLVAEDRAYGPGPSPVLFELLDAMDGAAADADLLFLLTTNRADLLEPALAARPGRVDVAVEIGLPDADARRRLLRLYSRDVPVQWDDALLDTAVERTAGVTASFVKELLRRAVLEALHDAPGRLTAVRAEHLERALDDLLDSTSSVTRALLGVPADQSAEPVGPPVRGAHGHGNVGWVAFGGEPGIEPTAYGSSLASSWDDEQ